MTNTYTARSSIPIALLVLLSIFIWRAASPLSSGLVDVDSYWHIMYGEWILDHRALPTVDEWSWTFHGATYRLTQWAGETLMAVFHRIAGTEGSQILSAALVSLTIGASYRAARCHLDSRVAALVVAIGCNGILLSLSNRPHQFTHLGLAVLTWLVSVYLVKGNKTPLYWIPVVLALWVNLHGGFVVGLVYLWMIAGLVFVDTYMNRVLPEKKAIILALSITALISTLATLANPYGVGAWQYVMEISSLKSSSAGIVDEWRPTNIKLESGLQFFLITTAVFAAMAFSRKRPTLQALLTTVALTAAGWSAARVSIMMSILLVPQLAQAFRNTALYDLAFGEAVERRAGKPIALPYAVLIIGVVSLFSILSGRSDTSIEKQLNKSLPVEEVRFMKEHAISGKILNPPEAGGYLISKLGIPVFMDTRLDLYKDKFFFEFMLANMVQSGSQEFLAKYNPDILMLGNHSALRQVVLAGSDYRLIFEGVPYSILVRKDFRTDLPTIEPSHEVDPIFEQLKS